MRNLFIYRAKFADPNDLFVDMSVIGLAFHNERSFVDGITNTQKNHVYHVDT